MTGVQTCALPISFSSASRLVEIAREVPGDQLLIETDCPYLAPAPHRGKRNEPAFVADTARFLAEARGVELQQLAQQYLKPEDFYEVVVV